jgi:hypothetical protein
MAERTVAAITAEVPAYTDPFRGRMGQNIENAVLTSIGAFLRMVTRAEDSGPGASAALEGAYELGRGEARQGRPIDALLAAFRVGARVAWLDLSATAVEAGLPAETIARFAAMLFAYIDELSASSASGHADELATAGRVRQRHLDRLARQLLAGEDLETLQSSATTAAWPEPETLTAVLLPNAQLSRAATVLNPASLYVSDDLPGVDPAGSWAVALVPDADGTARSALLTALAGRHAVVGPSRPWYSARSSYQRAGRARHLGAGGELVDTDEHLTELVLGADPEAAADLRRRALAPLLAHGPKSVDRLAETLRSWLLHQGRRDAVAAELFVHPQTVRYRMNQIREAYGESLNDPQVILELTVALGTFRTPVHGSADTSGGVSRSAG